jgi:HEAT repeat protein
MSLLLKWKLNSSNPDKRIAAIRELASSPDPQAATLIAQTLVRAIDLAKAVSKRPPSKKGNSLMDNVNVQHAAALALGELRDPCAVDALLRTLNDGSEQHVKYEAATALGRIKDKRAVVPLLEAISTRWKYSWGLLTGATAALGEIGDPAAVGPLQSLLKRAQEHYNDLRTRLDPAYNPNPTSRQLVERDLQEVSAALKVIPLVLQKLVKT